MKIFARLLSAVTVVAWLTGVCIAQIPKAPVTPAKTLAEWIAALKGNDGNLRSEARDALRPDGPFKDVAIAHLIEAFKDETRYGCFVETLSDYQTAAVPSLIAALKRREPGVRAGAAMSLGLIRPRPVETVPLLLIAMKDANAHVRGSAAGSLGNMRVATDEVISALMLGLNDPDAGVRENSAASLGELVRKPGPAILALAKLLTVKDNGVDWLDGVRWSTANAIASIGSAAAAAVPVLTAALRDKQQRHNRRYFAIALARMGPAAKEAVPTLLEVLKETDDSFYRCVALVFGTGRNLRPVTVFVKECFGSRPYEFVMDKLETVHSQHRELRKAIIHTLGSIGPDAAIAVPRLIDFVKDRMSLENDNAIAALGKIGPGAKAVVPHLIQMLAVQPNDSDVVETLGKIGPDSIAAIPTLMAIVRNRELDSSQRKTTAAAIAKIDPVLAAKEHLDIAHLDVRLGKIPVVNLPARTPVTVEQKTRIVAWIAALADTQSPDIGFSSSETGQNFAPIPGQRRRQVILFDGKKHRTSEAFRKLVETGPVALPYLLTAVDDPTPTQLRVSDSFGTLIVGGAEILCNPVNRFETRTFAKGELGKLKESTDPDLESGFQNRYTVKVGDICYVAIGQIVGRPYEAVKYVPTGIVVVNSTTSYPDAPKQLRAIWAGKDPTKSLLDSLLIDYATEGIFNGKTLAGWSEGSRYQIEATIRLLYYFPEETAPLIAARLKSLDVSVATSDASMQRDVKNRVATVAFIEAVSWCQAATIREALADIAKRSDDPQIKKLLTSDGK